MKKRAISWLLVLVLVIALAVPVSATVDGTVLSSQKLSLDGEAVDVEAYNIGGSNYFKLRDVAALLADSANAFSIDYSETEKSVSITVGKPYEPRGDELKKGSDNSASCVESAWTVKVDGKLMDVAAFNIGGSNYFKLRDLANAIGFGVSYDVTTRTVVMDSCGSVLTGESSGEYSGDLSLENGAVWTPNSNQTVKQLEIAEGADVKSEYPIIVFFESSDTIENGEVINNVQFVSDYDEVVALVHANDTHGFIQNEAYIKAYADSIKENEKYSLVLTINAGDVWGGGYVAAHGYEGELIPILMSKVYDFMVPGNADVSLTNTYNSTALLAALGESEGMPCLLANQKAVGDFSLSEFVKTYKPVIGNEMLVELYSALKLNDDGSIDWSGIEPEKYDCADGELPLEPTRTYTTELGTKIGFFGMDWFGRGGLWTGIPSIECAQTNADALAAEGCKAVVGVIHTGWPDNDPEMMAVSSNDTNSAQIALNTTGIDALIDAHTHSIINGGEGWMENDSLTFVNQAFCYGNAVGLMELYLKDGEIIAKDGQILLDFSGIEPDAEVQAIVDMIMNKLDEDGYTTVLAHTDIYLNGDRTSTGNVGGGVRANETNLGDLVADGVLQIAKDITGKDIDIALYPGYWVRASVAADSDITKSEISSIFANTTAVYYKEFTAEALVELMQKSVEKVGHAENNAFKHVSSGIKITYVDNGDLTNTLYSITIGETLIYENGEYKVGDDWKCSCAYTLTNPDAQNPAGNGWDPADEIVGTKEELTNLFCEYLLNYDEVIYDNVIAPDGRITEYK